MKESKLPPGDAIDMVAGDATTTELSLGAGESRDHLVSVATGLVSIKITHAAGSIGTMNLRVYDTDHPVIPIDSSDVTCAEPGCGLGLTVKVAPETRLLEVQVEASVAMTVRLDLERLEN